MANEVVQNKRPLLPIASRFADAPVEDLGEGIKSAMSALSIVGNVFGINQRKKYIELPPAKQRQIEVVILRGARTQSKAYYSKPYGTEPNPRPDCWSSDSITPDAAVEHKQSPQCNGCPKDAWVTAPNGRRQKMCGDNKRIALVPADDMKNEAYGGAMIFRVPSGSLNNLDIYSDEMKKMGIPYYAYTTLITLKIDAQKITRLEFEYGRPLTEEEADIVLDMREEQRVLQMVNDQVVPVEGGEPTNGEPPAAAGVVAQAPPPAAAAMGTPRVVQVAPQPPAVAAAVARAVAAAANINTAIARPATPPESQRTIKTMSPAVVAQEEADEGAAEVEEAGQVPNELDSMFGNLFPGDK